VIAEAFLISFSLAEAGGLTSGEIGKEYGSPRAPGLFLPRNFCHEYRQSKKEQPNGK
jgi:hypothetical protein